MASALLAGCGAGQAEVHSPSHGRDAAPVVVTIAVDQLAAWVLSERLDALPAEGGFARLRRDGLYVREARHPHAVTDTAPGHASLYTGAPPRVSGIFANEVVSNSAKKRASILKDPATTLLLADGSEGTAGSSAKVFSAPLLADVLRAERPDALIVSLSLKDRSAIPGGGHNPDAVLWFDDASASFVTSTAFSSSFPAWAKAAGGHAAVEAQMASPWTLLRPTWVAEHARTPDEQPGEGDIAGFGVVFPHDFARAQRSPLAFRASPMSDEGLLALADAAMTDPRFGEVPTLLAVSFSANDYVGHVFGPDSWEAWDQLARLDVTLGRLFGALDRRVGADRWSLVLSADHGTTPLPETLNVPGARPWCEAQAPDRWQRPCVAGGRLFMDVVASELQAAAEQRIGPGTWIAAVVDPYVYLSAQARALDPAKHAALIETLLGALGRNPLVGRVFETSKLPASCPPVRDESLEALVCRSFAKGAGELYVVPKPGAFFDPDYVVGKGVSHGTPALHDRAVPLLVRAPGRVAGGAVLDRPIVISAFVRTAASLLGISTPSGAVEGVDLTAHEER